MKKILSAIILLVLVTSASLQASPYYGYGQSPARTPQTEQAGPDKLLREGMTKLLRFMRQQERPNQQMIAGFVEREIAPYFDFDYMTNWVAGPMNRHMTDQQRAEMTNSVKQMLLSTLTKRLVGYENQDVRFYHPRRAGENEVKVRVGILQAGGYPANIDFRFYRSAGGWKVFDVSANGSSALTFYRQHFARQMGSQKRQRAYRR
ncbi:MAG: ABC transporter substrate-binding protein [Candidatus Thiodiazotropha sp. (ex Semelilucina semeliformis)]|nr:ABC transporter substrate-binding protein [Candidatus Thiodiazotropha sp. (ex Myrtea spinifera)]MCU7807710.1 ABC transporter substrate-binding protein [Candidatus Thiodiazotropha sp. (ex Semelilucina semeliformis)]MCU7828410.1 ABC transporter substrate-binding protein [Candidatus Thiodiazotropha sp. (ex Myrtea sp. 'scaly one' KF741663)]